MKNKKGTHSGENQDVPFVNMTAAWLICTVRLILDG